MHSGIDALEAEPGIQSDRRRVVVKHRQLGIFRTGNPSGFQHCAKYFLAVALASPGCIHLKIIDKQLLTVGALFEGVPDDADIFF